MKSLKIERRTLVMNGFGWTRRLILAMWFCVGSWLGAPPSASAQEVSDERVGEMIDQLIEIILDARNEDGHWDPGGGDRTDKKLGGTDLTVLALNALLYAGISPQDERLSRALSFIQANPPRRGYQAGIDAHVWAAMNDSYLPMLDRTTYWLVENTCRQTGGAGYMALTERNPEIHASTAHYVHLGLWEAAKRGRLRDPQIWNLAARYWIDGQQQDGRWGYMQRGRDDMRHVPRMTAAGVTILAIVQQELHRERSTPEPRVAAAINRAMAWLDEDFRGSGRRFFDNGHSGTPSGSANDSYGYHMVLVERAALATGRRYFGGHDWFQRGAAQIDGDIAGWARASNTPLVSASFGLIFLSRGRVPVWATKLELPGVAWNNRPNDLYFLTRALSDLREQELNFFVANLSRPADELVDTPVLYFSAPGSFTLNDEQLANLRRYIDLGGMLVLNNEGGSSGFEHSVEDLVEKLFPDRPFEAAPDDHPLYRSLFRIDPRRYRTRIVSNGVRDLVVYFDQDVGMRWQADRALLSPDNRSDVGRLSANLFVLATNRGSIPNRVESRLEMRDRRVDVDRKATIVRPRYSGNWLAEPGGWVAVGNWLHNQRGVHLVTSGSKWTAPAEGSIPERNRGRNQSALAETEGDVIDLSELGESRATLAHLTGTAVVELSREELAAIVEYVSNGGTVLVETVGGFGEFAGSVSRQLTEFLRGLDDHGFFPSRPLPLGAESSMISGEGINGFDATAVSFRRYTQYRLNLPDRPRLMALDHDGRPAIIFSEEDLTLGAMGVPRWGVVGYSRQGAKNLLGNIVLTALEARD
ncbi:MAG: DUF4159 domain-containing protein [Phycisphaeraceae bacterium]|nr:DUF4159 domain-containing protein [Phycisphaeraceae bacterium]